MNKRKILTLALAVCMVAILAVGGSLAYLTDTDAQTNTFTTGNVAIDLWENFGDNDDEGLEHLIPATGSAQNGTLENGVTKEIYVKNLGSEEAYVRVHIAIPAELDDGNPDFDASANVLHFNYEADSIGKDKWDWSKTTGEAYEGDWNYYTINIKETVGDEEVDVVYNVYVVTYGAKLAKNAETCAAIHQVYLDSEVTNDDITMLKEKLGDEWHIYVAAEGAQAAGFDDAYEALNEAFGDPSDSAYTTKIDWETVTGKTWGTNYEEAKAAPTKAPEVQG